MPLANSRRIGILGGTFDPIHLGHLLLAEEARSQLQLDGVYFVPAGDPPHKQERVITPVEHRIRMAELATATADCFWVSRVDADRPGPHFTSDMIPLLQAELGPAAQLYFLIGSDSLRDLPTWRNPESLLDHCRLVALTRPESEPDWAVLEGVFPGVRDCVTLLRMPLLEISSSDLRARVGAGQPIRYQVPCAVEAYIHKHRLYQQAAT
jgi:nicotinate-nucleotide adenylyltransferase